MTKTLTASNIRYLLIMQRLDPENKGTRCTDVAEKLKCSKPSVHNMMHTLRDMGIIRRDAYGESFFTEEGLALAERYSRYFDAVASLLADQFPEDDLLSGVCAFLSEMPERRWLPWKRRSVKWKSFPVPWRSWASLSCAA